MDDLTPMEPDYQEIPSQPQQQNPGYYGTGRQPRQEQTHTLVLLVLTAVLLTANLVTIFVLLGLRTKQLIDTAAPTESTMESLPSQVLSNLTTDQIRENTSSGDAELQISIADGAELSLRALYDKVKPSVVTVTCADTVGTGVIMTDDGYILTNAACLQGGDELTVTLSDGSGYSAARIGSDIATDLAVLKIDADGLPAAEFGDSDAVRTGDRAIAVSNPFDESLSGTMTVGIIAAVNENVTVSGRNTCIFQTDAAPGGVGGPLFNGAGQVIAINIGQVGTFISYQTVSDVGFALPVTEVQPLVQELIQQGYISGRAGLGIEILEIPAEKRQYWDLPEGVMIGSVNNGSSAQLAGLRAGDILTSLNDTAVTDAESYRRALNDFQAGDAVRVYVYRGGRQYYADLVFEAAAP